MELRHSCAGRGCLVAIHRRLLRPLSAARRAGIFICGEREIALLRIGLDFRFADRGKAGRLQKSLDRLARARRRAGRALLVQTGPGGAERRVASGFFTSIQRSEAAV
jgi:hypothetical protein